MQSRGVKRSNESSRRQYSPDNKRRRSTHDRRRSPRRIPNRSGKSSEHRKLIVSNFHADENRAQIKNAVSYILGQFGDCQVAVRRHPETGELLAYCTFRSATAARHAKKEGQTKGKEFYVKGKRLNVEFDEMKKRRERSRSRSHSNDRSNEKNFINGKCRRDRTCGGDSRRSPEKRTLPDKVEEIIPQPHKRFKNPIFTPPTDDPLASRSLYISGLDSTITEQMVTKLFKPFGSLESIELKNGSCFVNYKNVDMAYMAKLSLNNKMVGKTPMQIKYGKVKVTSKIWVGGIERHVSKDDLYDEFDRFGVIERIEFKKGGDCASIRFETEAAALEAVKQMKGYLMAGTGTRLKTDFLELEPHQYSKLYTSRAQDLMSNPSPTLKLMKNVDKAEIDFKHDQAKSAVSLKDLCRSFFAPFWRGDFPLKGYNFPVYLFHLKGEKSVFNKCIADSDSSTGRKPFIEATSMFGERNFAKIMQRLELPDVQKDSCLLLAVPGQPRDLTNVSDPECNIKPFAGYVKFFTYQGLKTACTKFYKTSERKELVGSMIAFPPCQLVTQELLKIGPNLQTDEFPPEYMLVYFVAGPGNVF